MSPPGLAATLDGYRTRMTTTPNEPSPDPEVVPSGDPTPTDPIEPIDPGDPPEATPLP